MSLVVGEGVGKYYGEQDVLHNLYCRIEAADRIGLVGVNGEGKTTLLRLLAGLEDPTSGHIHHKKDLRLGYLPQDPPGLEPTPLWDAMLQVYEDLRRMEAELAELAAQLETPDCPPQTLATYSALQAAFEQQDGYAYETRIRMVLTGLGFSAADFTHPLDTLSGGQRTRALLARLLLEAPDLLLLDEPTNHLDLQAVEWLEHWMQEYTGALVIVSHDRYFLDKTTNRTWEIAFGGLEAYRGNYSSYLRQRQERFAQRLKEWEAQQEYIARTEDFIRRHIAGQRTREAQGRRKHLERFMARQAIAKPQRHKRLRLRLIPAKRSGDIVLQLNDLSIGHQQDRPLAQIPPIEVRRGDRIALIGPNGAGKTTLVRTILEEIPQIHGTIRHGANVEMGYLPQAHDYLEADLNTIEAVQQVKPGLRPAAVRALLGTFLLSGDEVFKRLSQLSGGQRSRIALARLAVLDANLLILDEPSNHLDIPSQEVLTDALLNFAGTLLLVSHDRFLIQAVATHIWHMDQGTLTVFKGNWDEYIAWRENAADSPAVTPEKTDRQAQRQAQRQERRQRKEAEKMRQRQAELETQIHAYETTLEGLSVRIGRAGETQDMDRVHALGEEYRQLERQIEALMEEWESLAGHLEELEEAP